LEEERTVLNSAERLRELCTLVYESIKGGDTGDDFQSALDLLRPALKALNELSRLDKDLEEHETNLSESVFRLEDVAASISSYESDIEDDPQRLSEVEERLDLIARLKRKYGITTIEEILQRAADDQSELETIVHRDELIESLQQQDRLLRQEIGRIAQGISERRHEAALLLSTAMEEQLNDLNMQRARFSVEIEQVPDPGGVPASIHGQPEQLYTCDVTGIDRVQFLIAAADATPTLIFDEIDAGISGRSGQIVGEKLWQLTRNHQVICVTHLPQIAAFADTHYNVNKQVYDERTFTRVNELRPEQRVREIAYIIGGNATDFSMKSAEEILARSYLWKENWAKQRMG
jgi:DNA repair protein RecN (Recombination protein N)